MNSGEQNVLVTDLKRGSSDERVTESRIRVDALVAEVSVYVRSPFSSWAGIK